MAPKTLTPEQTKIVTESAIKFKDLGPKLSTLMYDLFFEMDPELKKKFSADFLVKKGNEKITIMAKTQAHVVFSFMEAIEEPESLKSDLERVAMKHVSRDIRPELYPHYGEALIKAVKILFKEEATQELVDAWTAAYQFMAATLIEMENQYRAAQEKAPGSWIGFRTFKLSKIEEEADDDFSDMSGDEDGDEDDDFKTKVYYFVPEDGKELPNFDKSQYVCLKLDLPGTGLTHRNYMLAKECAPGQGSLSIRFNSKDASLITKYIFNEFHEGDTIELSAPIGYFLLMESLN